MRGRRCCSLVSRIIDIRLLRCNYNHKNVTRRPRHFSRIDLEFHTRSPKRKRLRMAWKRTIICRRFVSGDEYVGGCGKSS